jgi:Protein of unknown function (DUF559)
LIVELDGGQHAESPEDQQRDRVLCALGYRVIRIWNNDVIENLDGVLQRLLSELEKSPSPHPRAYKRLPDRGGRPGGSPRKRGEGVFLHSC